MKKKLFFVAAILFFLPIFAFAQIPSFEILCADSADPACHPYPAVENVTILRQGEGVIITANISDVSGVASSVAIIKNSAGTELPREIMYDDSSHNDGQAGNGTFGTNVLSYAPDTYSVSILAADSLGNSGVYENVSSFRVGLPETQIGLTATPNNAWPEDIISLSARLTLNGSPLPGKTIIFTDETSTPAATIGTAQNTDSNGLAVISYTVPTDASAGRAIKANFNGDGTNASASATIDLPILSGPRTVQFNPFTVHPDSIPVGTTGPIAISATLTSGGRTLPNKTITFSDIYTNPIGTVSTNSSGIATISYAIPTSAEIGTDTITASFAGDSVYAPKSDNIAFTILGEPSQISSLIADPPTVITGGGTNMRARLLNSNGQPMANERILFFDQGFYIGEGATASDGWTNAVYYGTMISSNPGAHVLEAIFAGNATHNGSSASTVLNVLTPTQITSLTVNPSSVTQGGSVFLSATIREFDGTPIPGLTIIFSDAGFRLGTGTTNSSGTAIATAAIPGTPSYWGERTITASFDGDSTRFASSAQTQLSIAVATQIISFTADPMIAGPGSSINLSANFRYKYINSSLEFRTIRFRDETASRDIGQSLTDSNGTATIVYGVPTSEIPAAHTLNAIFDGNNLEGSSYRSTNINIGQLTRVALSIPAAFPNGVTVGSVVNISGRLMNSDGSGLGNKIISFTDETDGVLMGAALTDSRGEASIDYYIPIASGGNHRVNAHFDGDTVYAPSSDSLSATFNLIPTSFDPFIVTYRFTSDYPPYDVIIDIFARLNPPAENEPIEFNKGVTFTNAIGYVNVSFFAYSGQNYTIRLYYRGNQALGLAGASVEKFISIPPNPNHP